MHYIVEDELENLENILKINKMEVDKANNFVDESDYEDEYSHNQIDEFKYEFMKEAVKYLTENYKGRYVIYCDWCVHIVTIQFYNDKNLRRGTFC